MDKNDIVIRNLKDDIKSKSSLNNDLNKKIKEITSSYQKCNSTIIQSERILNNLQNKMNDLSNQFSNLKSRNSQLSLSYKTKTEIELEQRKQFIKLEKNILLLKETNNQINKAYQELIQSSSLSKIEILKLETEKMNLKNNLHLKSSEINDTIALTKKLFTEQEDHLQQIRFLQTDNKHLYHQISLLNNTLLHQNDVYQKDIQKYINDSKDKEFLNTKYKLHIDLLSQAIQQIMINNSTQYAMIQRNILKELNSNSIPVQPSSSSSSLMPEYLVCPSNDVFYQLKYQFFHSTSRSQFTTHALNDYNQMGNSYYAFNIGIISVCFLILGTFLRHVLNGGMKTVSRSRKKASSTAMVDNDHHHHNNRRRGVAMNPQNQNNLNDDDDVPKNATNKSNTVITTPSTDTAAAVSLAKSTVVITEGVDRSFFSMTNISKARSHPPATATTAITSSSASAYTTATTTTTSTNTNEKENVNCINTTSLININTTTASTTSTTTAINTNATAGNSISFNRMIAFFNRQQQHNRNDHSTVTDNKRKGGGGAVDTAAVTEFTAASGASVGSDSEASTPRKATLSVPFSSFYVSHNRSNDADDEDDDDDDKDTNNDSDKMHDIYNHSAIPSVEVSLSRSATPPLVTGSGSGSNSLHNSSSSMQSISLMALRSQKYHGHIVYDTDESDFDLTPRIRPNLNSTSFYVPNVNNNRQNDDGDDDSDKVILADKNKMRGTVLNNTATTTGIMPSPISSNNNTTTATTTMTTNRTPNRHLTSTSNNKTPVSVNNNSSTNNHVMKTPKTVNKGARATKNRNSGVKFAESARASTSVTTASTGASVTTPTTTPGADDSVVVSQAPDSESDCGSEDSTPRATGTQNSPINYYRGGSGVGNISRNSSPDVNRKIPDLKLTNNSTNSSGSSSGSSGDNKDHSGLKNKTKIHEADISSLVTESFIQHNIQYNYSQTTTVTETTMTGSTGSGSNSQQVTPRINMPLTSRSVKLSGAPTVDSGRSTHSASILGTSIESDSRSVTPRVNRDHTSRSSTPRSHGPYRTSSRNKSIADGVGGVGGEEEVPSSRDVTPRLNGRLLKEDGLTISRSASHSRSHSTSPMQNDGSREVTPRRIQPSSRSITPGPNRNSRSNSCGNNSSKNSNKNFIVNSSHSSHHNSHNNNNNNRRYRNNNNGHATMNHHDQDIDGDRLDNYDNDINDDNASDSRSVTPRLRTPSVNALPSSRSVTPRARSHHSHSTSHNNYVTAETTSRSATPVLVTSPRTPSHPHPHGATTANSTTMSSLTILAASSGGSGTGSRSGNNSSFGSPTTAVADRRVNTPSSYLMSMLNTTATSTTNTTTGGSNNTTSTSSTVSTTHK